MHSSSPGLSSQSTMLMNSLLVPHNNREFISSRDVNANSVGGVSNMADDDESGDAVDFVDEWSSPTHGPPRSRSWFCCANDAADAHQPNLRRRPLSCHYSIVRTEPKSQAEIVIPII